VTITAKQGTGLQAHISKAAPTNGKNVSAKRMFINKGACGAPPSPVSFDKEGPWTGIVRVIERLGNESIAYVEAEAGEITVRTMGNVQWRGGRLAPLQDHMQRFDRTGERLAG